MGYPKIVHPSWHLCPAWEHTENIRKQLIPGTFCPTDPNLIFRALRQPLDNVKIILISQDPYPDQRFACGLTYAVPEQYATFESWPKSLQVIADSMREFAIDPEQIEKYFDQTMKWWENYGILLLNSNLTCNIGVPGSHSSLWETFMKDLIRWICEIRTGLIWYFHGGLARERFDRLIFDMAHHKFYSRHPAARTGEFDTKFREIKDLYYNLYREELHLTIPF